MNVRKTKVSDLDAVMEIIELARGYFREQGIPQWQGPYPERKCIIEDIENDRSYVCEIDGGVVGVCAIVGGVEADYINIYEGEWKNDREYICIHRVAVHPDAKGKGVAGAFVGEASRIALERGLYDVKCDTHEMNLNMRRMLQKNGFEYCGVIYLSSDGEPRVAYQKRLDRN